jgi:hypothetical protein
VEIGISEILSLVQDIRTIVGNMQAAAGGEGAVSDPFSGSAEIEVTDVRGATLPPARERRRQS